VSTAKDGTESRRDGRNAARFETEHIGSIAIRLFRERKDGPPTAASVERNQGRAARQPWWCNLPIDRSWFGEKIGGHTIKHEGRLHNSNPCPSTGE
jgi:hypothetical protein